MKSSSSLPSKSSPLISTHHPLPQKVLWKKLAWPERFRLLGVCFTLAIGVGALFGVMNLLSTVNHALYGQARDLLGGDLVISSWRALNDEWSQNAERLLLEKGDVSKQIEMASMAQISPTDEKSQSSSSAPFLVSLKAIDAHYPLRGTLTFHTSPETPHLQKNQIWINQSLHTQRHLKIGDSLLIGNHPFLIAGILQKEPDGGMTGALSFAPRVMMRKSDLVAIKLIQKGSRVRRKWVFAFSTPPANPRQTLETLSTQLQNTAPDTHQIQSYLNANLGQAQIFERITLFFAMIAFVTLALSLLALISGLWSFMQDQLPLLALLRALGCDPPSLHRFYQVLCLTLGGIAGFLGIGLGLLLHWSLLQLAQSWFSTPFPFEIDPLLVGATLALTLLATWIIHWGLQQGLNRQNVQALWMNPNPQLGIRGYEYGVMALVLCGLMGGILYLMSGSWILALLFVGGLVGLLMVISIQIGLGRSVLKVIHRLASKGSGIGLRFTVRHLLGHPHRTWVALMSMTLALSLIATLNHLQANLNQVLDLQRSKPPQFFLIDIQTDQKQSVLESAQTLKIDPPTLYPLIRARISKMKGKAIHPHTLPNQTPADRLMKRQLTREYNLTTRAKMNSTDSLVQGRWWTGQEAQHPETPWVSLEERFAQRLGLKLGDTLTFEVQGRELQTRVLNLRQVNWSSFMPNFFVILPPKRFESAPKTWISSISMDSDEHYSQFSKMLYEKASNISLIDLRPIIQEVQKLLASLSQALNLTGGVCAFAGLILLLVGFKRDHQKRASTVRLLDDLGLPNKQGWTWMRGELMIVGALSCFMILSTSIGLSVLGLRALNLPVNFFWSTLLLWSGCALILPWVLGLIPGMHKEST